MVGVGSLWMAGGSPALSKIVDVVTYLFTGAADEKRISGWPSGIAISGTTVFTEDSHLIRLSAVHPLHQPMRR